MRRLRLLVLHRPQLSETRGGRPMPLEVIRAGLGRTGTSSLRKAPWVLLRMFVFNPLR